MKRIQMALLLQAISLVLPHNVNGQYRELKSCPTVKKNTNSIVNFITASVRDKAGTKPQF